MLSILALGAAERLINHAIDLDAITRVQLNQLQGKTLRVIIDSPQLSVDVWFDQDKVRLEATATGQAEKPSLFEQRPFDQANAITEATATLQVDTLVALFKLLTSDEIGTLPLQGDYHLLQDIQRIIQQTQPDVAAHLSRWVSPALAHEIGKLQQLPKHLKRSLQSKLFFAEDFIKEDSGLFAPRWQMDDLQQQTRQLNQNIDRLEAKIQQLHLQLNFNQD